MMGHDSEDRASTLFNNPVFLGGLLSPFVIRVPVVKMTTLTGFADTVERMK
jgi:hypothetical protein